ncbi:Acyltransferase 3 [Trinorchestia longiramus]|nr:Acyltransferase 3 [Trinorchestia longiramus]
MWCLAAVLPSAFPAAMGKDKKLNSVVAPLEVAAVDRNLLTGERPNDAPSNRGLNEVPESSLTSSENQSSVIYETSESVAPEEPLTHFGIDVASVRKTFSEIAPFYLPVTKKQRWKSDILESNVTLSKRCERDVNAIYNSFLGPAKVFSRIWPFQLFDSWGKSGDGLLYGNRQWLGFMEQCLATTGRSNTLQFTGQYCWIFTKLDGQDFTNILSEAEVVLPQSYGTCIPSSCTEEELRVGEFGGATGGFSVCTCGRSVSAKERIRRRLNLGDYRLVSVTQFSNMEASPDPVIRTLFIAVVSIQASLFSISSSVLGALTLPVVVATIVQLFRDELPRVVKAFSFIENWKKITTIRQKVPGEISCLHCIRVLSISWVMLSHQYFFIGPRGDNTIKMKMMSQEWAFQMVWSGYKAVDTFFTIGGLLTGIILMKRDFCLERPNKPYKTQNATLEPYTVGRKKRKEIPSSTNELDEPSLDCMQTRKEFVIQQHRLPSDWQLIRQQGMPKTLCVFFTRYAVYVLHRLFRITPAILVVVMICAGPSTLFVQGVFKRLFEKDYLVECRKDWWVDLTMFSNILSAPQGFPYGNNDTEANFRGCIGSTWYLGVDFQVYLAAPFLLFPVKMLGRYKWLYTAGVALVFCLIAGIVTMTQDLLPASLMTFDKQAVNDYMRWFYLMPYTRVAPYFIGAFFGLLLVDADVAVRKGDADGPRWLKVLRKKEVQVLGWTVFTATCLAVVFGLTNINYYSLRNPQPELSPAATFFYASFDSAAWACCIGWIILTCSFGLAGPIDEFLSHPIWQVPSRVTYSVYLISLPLQGFIFYSGYRLIHLSHLTLLLGYGGVVVLSFLSGILISFVGEAPYVALGKIMTGRS